MTEEQVAEIARLEAAYRSAEEREREKRDAYREAQIASFSAVNAADVSNAEALAEAGDEWRKARASADAVWCAWQYAVRVRVELPS